MNDTLLHVDLIDVHHGNQVEGRHQPWEAKTGRESRSSNPVVVNYRLLTLAPSTRSVERNDSGRSRSKDSHRSPVDQKGVATFDPDC